MQFIYDLGFMLKSKARRTMGWLWNKTTSVRFKCCCRRIRFHIDDLNFKKRHKLVHEKVSEKRREMHDEQIIKAWDIPELEKYLYADPDDSKDIDY